MTMINLLRNLMSFLFIYFFTLCFCAIKSLMHSWSSLWFFAVTQRNTKNPHHHPRVIVENFQPGVFFTDAHWDKRTDKQICTSSRARHCQSWLWPIRGAVLYSQNYFLSWEEVFLSSSTEPIVRNGRPPSAHSVHSFLHQYTGSFKKPPLRRPQSVIGGGLGSLMVMPRNGSRLGETHAGRHRVVVWLWTDV